MLTQCPSCQTTFRVTSEILRVADGQVRCGRCQTQFDALECLIEENDAGEIEPLRYLRPSGVPPPAAPPPTPAEPSAPLPSTRPPSPPPSAGPAVAPASASLANVTTTGEIEVGEPIVHEDITMEGRHIEITGTYEVIDESGNGEPRLREEVIEEWVEIDDFSEDFDNDALRSDAFVESDDRVELDPETLQGSADERVDAYAEPLVAEPRDSVAGPGATDDTQAPLERLEQHEALAGPEQAGRTEREDLAELDLLAPPRRSRTAWLWKALAAPLALLLIGQVVHDHRATLARHPRVGPTLVKVYDALGLSLHPQWDLHAYEVRQWGIISDPGAPGTLRVRASIKNLAGFAQPYPLLKLVLENRWGEQVRAREFEPSEYLDPTTAPDRLLAPAQQANATIAIVDPGPDAEGFRFDICLRGTAGPVCAADVPIR